MQLKHVEAKALAQGTMNIIIPGFDTTPLAFRDHVAYVVTKMLHAGHHVVGEDAAKDSRFLAVGTRLAGFMVSHYEVGSRTHLPVHMQPHIGVPVVAAEARVPGLDCRMALLGGNRDVRKWLVVFGTLDLELTRQALNLPLALRETEGVLQFASRSNIRDTRTALWQAQNNQGK